MKRSILISLALIAILIFIAVGFYALKIFKNTANNSSGTNAKKSEVKMVDGVPKLFIDGKEISSSAVNVYYYPPQGKNHAPAYNDAKWLANMKALIDRAVANNTKLILLNVWWSDLDKSTSRPKNIGDNFDFAQLDAVFSYAGQKGAYIVPIFTLFPFDPDWWLKENNFPPHNTGGKVCDFCETDSAGNVYNNASMNSDIAQRDFGGFVTAIVDHYKNNPALVGWDMGTGATGEDGYGPNYIALKAENIDNLPKFEIKSGTYTDYSPFFERKFKEWIKKKYSSDQKLQAAWNDKFVSLESLKIPKPAGMFQNEKSLPPVFPDPTDIFALAGMGTDGKDNLNPRGLDFYEFRNEMRQKDREYYASLIKNNDPNHVLLLNGASDDLFSQAFNFDGVAFSMAGTVDKAEESRYYYTVTDISKRAAKYQKLTIISDEHVCDGAERSKNGECETPDQLSFVEKLGKSVKCTGGIFAPAFGYYDKEYLADKSSWIPPIWFSDKAMTAAKNIADYQLSGNCACSLASGMYSENKCDSSWMPGCEWLAKTYESFCNVKVQNNKGSTSNGQGKCGDGTCDQIEKQSGMCPQDCK